MSTVIQDLRYAVRSFARAPRFTVPAVLALALGIGATCAIFSVVRGVLLRPLPYSNPDRIVVIWENNLRRGASRNVIGPANFVAWRERNKSFEYLGMTGPSRLTLMLGGQPEEVAGMLASADVFRALGVQPVMGRTFDPSEDEQGRDAVLILSYEFWQRRLGGQPGIIGTTIVANGLPRTVIGVMPAGFTIHGERADYFRTYGWTIEQLRASLGRGSSHAIARLRDGVSVEQAASEMKAIGADLEKEFPRRNTNWSVTVVPIHEQTVDQIRPALMVLVGAVLFVLLIACVNVANLLLARSTVREREMGMRAALGAKRSRLVGQLLTESLLLASLGGVAGLTLAFAFHRGLLALVANRIPVPRIDQVALDLPMLALTMTLALATGLLFGFVPALIASRTVSDTLREGGRHSGGPRSRRVLGTLVVAEVALSLVLLAGAGLLIRSFVNLQNVDVGMKTSGLLTARVQLPGSRYNDERKSAGFFTDAVSRIAALPGVQSAAGVSFLPLAGLGIGTSFYRMDQPEPGPGQHPTTQVRPVTPGFFKTMGIPQLAGRDFTLADQADSPEVAIVSETLVRRIFPGENPLGKKIQVFVKRDSGIHPEIVGVVGNIKMSNLEDEMPTAVYIPHTQLNIGLMTFVVRTSTEPLSLVNSVAASVRAIDPELPIADAQTMEDVIDARLARPRIVAVLLAVFALMALLLAGVGVYGVMAYSVAQRTQEIGVRIALGASPQSVFKLVITQALRLVAIGVVVGLVAAGGLTRLLTTLLYQTEAIDPVTFAATAVILVAVATLAAYVPARRGTRVAPVEALRAE